MKSSWCIAVFSLFSAVSHVAAQQDDSSAGVIAGSVAAGGLAAVGVGAGAVALARKRRRDRERQAMELSPRSSRSLEHRPVALSRYDSIRSWTTASSSRQSPRNGNPWASSRSSSANSQGHKREMDSLYRDADEALAQTRRTQLQPDRSSSASSRTSSSASSGTQDGDIRSVHSSEMSYKPGHWKLKRPWTGRGVLGGIDSRSTSASSMHRPTRHR